ncbi:MAG: hypothetical protein ACFNP6_05140, partial [Scardovia wiggsiae]
HKGYRYSNLFSGEPEKINSVKTLSELKAAINGLKLKEGSLERKILDKRYNRLLSESLENSTRRRYYELTKILNPNDVPIIGYVSSLIFGVLGALALLCFCILSSIKEEYKKYLVLFIIILIIVFFITFLASLRVYSKKVWSKSFDKDIRDSYHYRNHYYPIILSDKSLNKSLELVICREKQRKVWKIGFGISGFLSVLFPWLTVVFALKNKGDAAFSFFALSFVLIIILLMVAAFSLAPTSAAPQKETLPKIETVESENEKWHEDKNKEKYFHKLIEYIAQSRDSVLYIGSKGVDNSVPSHYIDLVSTSYRYMSIENLKRDNKSLKKASYGTVIVDFNNLPINEIPKEDIEILGKISLLLKPDGELFIKSGEKNEPKWRILIDTLRVLKLKKRWFRPYDFYLIIMAPKIALEYKRKALEISMNNTVKYFPTELELYQTFGFRKNGN